MGIPKPLVRANQIFIVITVLLGLILSYHLLWVPFVVGIVTIITKRNPIVLVGMKLLKDKDYSKEDEKQQLFNQWIVTILLLSSLVLFYLGFSTLATIVGILIVLAAAGAIFGYCIGCTVRFKLMMWRHNFKKWKSTKKK